MKSDLIFFFFFWYFNEIQNLTLYEKFTSELKIRHK